MWPEAFTEQISQILGPEKEAFFEALRSSPVVSLRQNPSKRINTTFDHPIPWCSEGFYLKERPSFTLDPFFHSGCYYVQDASSMFLEQAIRQTTDLSKPIRVLDLCGAPGGKTTHLLSLISRNSILVTNEVIRSRVSILTMNVEKWGYSNVLVTNNDPSDFTELESFFDVVVVDAPCSGEGLFRKDPQASSEWSLDAVKLCSARQQRILEDIWPTVKPGGVVVYSTCTFNESENEGTVASVLKKYKAESLALRIEDHWRVTAHQKDGVHGYRFYPHKTQGEGFFLSVLRKGEEETVSVSGRRKKREPEIKEAAFFKNLLREPEHFLLSEKGDLVLAIPNDVAEVREQLENRLTIVHSGLAMGTLKHGKLIPDHALALSNDLKPGSFSEIQLTHEEALRYLRKETLTPVGAGMTRFTYGGFGLGWGNVVAGRVNNLLPNSYRIMNK